MNGMMADFHDSLPRAVCYLNVTPNKQRISSLQKIADVRRTILFIADLFRWLMCNSVRTSRNLSSFNPADRAQVNSGAMTTQRAWAT
jgi:hypothetical protein